jgi:hypothetical protein
MAKVSLRTSTVLPHARACSVAANRSSSRGKSAFAKQAETWSTEVTPAVVKACRTASATLSTAA